jgi:hypothetical protein
LIEFKTVERINQFVATLPPNIMDRAINWAYLSETADSFAIEREAPSEDKSRRSMQLLRSVLCSCTPSWTATAACRAF